jgi:outer membrane receptor for ferrienterochelin and colicin
MKLNRFLAVLATVLLIGIPAFAQTTANLTGTVTLGGNPLPGATVTISSPNLLGTRTAVTDANGNYNFGALPPGDYTVKFEMESMTTQTKTTRVGLATTARADADMKLTAVAEAITVTASAPAVLETTEVQTNMTQKLINDLPIARDLRGTVGLAPGVTNTGPGGNQVISGAPSFDNLYLIDGATVNENLRGQPHDLFIEDAIQETTVLTGAISAEYGRFTGGVVTAVSKSGGNEFSGTFRDSFQAPKWTAKSPLSTTLNRGKHVNQTYEATLGGRIIRDRLWFFVAGRHFKTTDPRSLSNQPGTINAAIAAPTYVFGRKQDREELKLTGQINPKHSLTLSGLNITDKQTNNPFGSPLEFRSLDAARETPNSFKTGHYNGVITNSFLLEASGAEKRFAFKGSGGDALGDVVNGTNAYDSTGARFFGAPTFCGVCTTELRNNRNWTVKGTYYLSSKAMGTHNIVAGIDNWHSQRLSDNHQSASDYTLGMYDTQSSCPPSMKNCGIVRQADGSIRISAQTGNTVIIWWPILESSKGTDLNTKSVFVNDKWDFNNKLSFNLGGRYDINKAQDSAHQKVADDSKISPRLGLTFDTFGNGRLRLNASYSQYVAAIADGNVADSASPAGSPSYLYWLYYGPNIENATSVEFFKKVFDWFSSVGGTNNKDFLLGGKTNGLGSRIPEPLKSPYVGEWTVGAGMQIGSKGFARADYITRKWKNFYTGETNLGTGQVFDPLSGGPTDISIVTTTNDFKREYNALQIQASYALFTRLNLGGNYTYGKTKGNHGAETSGSGPVANAGPGSYPEYQGYANFNPEGYLTSDQRHKVRAWLSFDQPTRVGTFNLSVLERYDSGTPYSALGTIDPRRRPAAPFDPANPSTTSVLITNPGYVFPPTTSNYYFSKRGEFRTDNVTATDIALNWNLPPLLGKVQFYAETELRNAFNRHAVTGVDQTIVTNKQSSSFRSFNPFTDTPKECPQGTALAQCRAMGANWQKGTNFGKPTTGTTFTTAGSFQLPRTFLISAGAKF